MPHFLRIFFSLLISVFLLQGCLIVQTPIIYEEAKRDQPYDVIIVPGVPYQDAGMADIMNFRVRWAKHLMDEGITRHLIFSGGAVYTPYVEGKIMALMAEKLGVPANRIFVEGKAEHSTENMYYGYVLAKKLGFERIGLASDQYQSFMLEVVHERFKLFDLGFIPIKPTFMRDVDKTPIQIDASLAKVTDFVALPDRQSLADRFKGTRGKYIEEEMKRNEAENGTR
jgi:hypothetical protein